MRQRLPTHNEVMGAALQVVHKAISEYLPPETLGQEVIQVAVESSAAVVLKRLVDLGWRAPVTIDGEPTPFYRVESLGIVMTVYEDVEGKKLGHAFPDVEKFGPRESHIIMWRIWPGWHSSGELSITNIPEVLAEAESSEPVYASLTEYLDTVNPLFPDDFDEVALLQEWRGDQREL